jgi:NDP-sugar pyrophosphorylase family protein
VFRDGKIVAYDKKNRNNEMQYIDYGLGILKKSAFDLMINRDIFDLSELYQSLISKGEMCGYEAIERFYEIGSLEGLRETEKYILNTKRLELGNE